MREPTVRVAGVKPVYLVSAFAVDKDLPKTVEFAQKFVNVLAWSYLALLLVRCIQLGWIYWRTLRIRRSAYPREIPIALARSWKACQPLFETDPIPLLCSEDVKSPSILGWQRPVLLVPLRFFVGQIDEGDALAHAH